MFRFLKGAIFSNTVQLNSILLAVWAALYNSSVIQDNPEFAAIAGGIQAILNILLRAKTKVPLSER